MHPLRCLRHRTSLPHMFAPWENEGDKLPRVVIIENVRGLTFERNAALLAHAKDCLQALHYSIHIRIFCKSQSAVPQSRGRC